MTEALILINTDTKGATEEVTKKLGEMDEVDCVAMITGSFDVMAIISTADIRGVITKIRHIEGVRDTNTNVIIAEHFSKGIEKKFKSD